MQTTSFHGFAPIGSIALLAFACSAESGAPEGGGSGGASSASGGSSSSGVPATFGGGANNTSGGTSSTSGGAVSLGGASPGAGGASNSSGGATTTNGGSSTTTGGAGTTTGGTPSASGGASTTTGGSTGSTTGGSGGAVTGCADGCAQLKVPFTAYKSGQAFEIYLPAPVDLSAGVVSVKLRATAGKAGGIQIVLKNGMANMYAWAQSAWSPIGDAAKAEWSTITLNAASPSGMDMTNVFDKTQVSIITIQVSAGDPWYLDEAKTMQDPSALVNPTVLLVDEITVVGATGAGPWTFTMNVTDLKVGDYMPVTGSSVTWLPPG